MEIYKFGWHSVGSQVSTHNLRPNNILNIIVIVNIVAHIFDLSRFSLNLSNKKPYEILYMFKNIYVHALILILMVFLYLR